MWSRTYLTSKLYDKITKTPTKSHETIPLRSSTEQTGSQRLTTENLGNAALSNLIVLIELNRYGLWNEIFSVAISCNNGVGIFLLEN
jgi:hypothetical protein